MTTTTKTTEITVKAEVTEEVLAGLLITAVEGGIYGVGCWATVEDYDCAGWPENPETVWVDITDNETGRTIQVTPYTIGVGVQRILNKEVALNDEWCGWIWQEITGNLGAVDAPAADAIVQAGLFNEVRYG